MIFLVQFGSDATRLLLFALAVVGLFLLMRFFQKRNERKYDFPDQAFGSHDALTNTSADAPVHPTMRFDQIELRRFYLHEFDVMTGPPDPFEFVDELTVQVEHLATGERSQWDFTIGTPSGFARLLERKAWESFYSPEVFVIRKYELEMVREMIVEHITEVISSGPTRPQDSPSSSLSDPSLS